MIDSLTVDAFRSDQGYEAFSPKDYYDTKRVKAFVDTQRAKVRNSDLVEELG